MKCGYTPKWVHPKKMITHFSEVFKDVEVKKTSLRNLLLVILAVSVAKTFRINAIAARLPIVVKKEKSKQKRLLRFLETALPLDALMEAWCLFVCRWVWKPRTQDYFYVLIDETDLPNGWKALVVSIPFRNRAIPIFWLVYEDQEIRNITYKSHNTRIQDFCLKVNDLTLSVLGNKKQKPLFVFDRGFARAQYIIDFLKKTTVPSSCVSAAMLASFTKATQRNLITWTPAAIQTCFIIKNTRSNSTFISIETRRSKNLCISSQMFIKTLKSITATNAECRSNTDSETSRPASASGISF